MNTSDKDNITILQAVFNKYDKDKTGYLTIDEFTQLLFGLSKHVRELKGIESLKAEAVFSLLDKDVDGKLSFVEFRFWWEKQDKYEIFCGERARKIRKAYKLFSSHTKDSQTSLSHSGFNNLITKMGIGFECDELYFDDLDLDNDGKLSFEEFCIWLKWF